MKKQNTGDVHLIVGSNYRSLRSAVRLTLKKVSLFCLNNNQQLPSKLIIVSFLKHEKLISYFKKFNSPTDFRSIGVEISKKDYGFINSFLDLLHTNTVILTPGETPFDLRKYCKNKPLINMILPFEEMEVEEIFPKIQESENKINFWYMLRRNIRTQKFGFGMKKHDYIKGNANINLLAMGPSKAFFEDETQYKRFNSFFDKNKNINLNSFETDFVLSKNKDLNNDLNYFVENNYPYLINKIHQNKCNNPSDLINEILPSLIIYNYQLNNPKENMNSTGNLLRIVNILFSKEMILKTKSELYMDVYEELINNYDIDADVRKTIENKSPDILKIFGNKIFYLIEGKNTAEYSNKYLYPIWDIFLGEPDEESIISHEPLKNDFIDFQKRMLQKYFPVFHNYFETSIESFFTDLNGLNLMLELFYVKFMLIKNINNPIDAQKYLLVIIYYQYLLLLGHKSSDIYKKLSDKANLTPSGVKAIIHRKLGMEQYISGNIFDLILPI